jgi:hypothetical protein
METKHLFSTNPSFLLQRLIEQYQKQDKLIVAYDFDDTVKPYWCAGCTEVQSLLRKIRNTIDAYFIVYTCNKDHDKIRAFLDKWDIPYDSINENAPFAPDIDGKLFYNVFLDDKAGLGEVVNTLEQFLYLVRNNYIQKTKNNENKQSKYKSEEEMTKKGVEILRHIEKNKKSHIDTVDQALFKFAETLDKWFDSIDKFLGIG